MEWTLLMLLAAVMVVPVVLLYGYAGCSFNPQSGYFPGVPVDLTVTNVSSGSVSLSWFQSDDAEGVTFEVERLRNGDTTPVILPTTGTTFTDTGLLPLTLYRYRVRAVFGALTTDFTTQVEATTLALVPQVCFTSTLMTDQPGLEGFCLVQRIEPTRLAAGGTQVFITVRGSTVGNLVIDRVFISQPAAAGNPYDSSTDLTLVATSVTVPANTPVALPVVAYTLDRTRPLLVCFDISATGGQGNVRFQNPVPAAEATMFFRPATAEASVADRLPSAANPGATPYNTSNSIYLIERIEVA
ncbi:fibronectin type III domain-containing protein [Roseimicrobium sp. ORNL1]|uniref:fibronectin type III domain-containing protein n=1 Tax=Roseimicrobium sp. ORNL1 TaxID=2711231 RepID=UPI0013E1DB6D|nr:fibronectin type III domain-containing protein [Roseimicrobium sp. ORNL1]QIF04535.1 fibronectin type III domain-containing protein [Roseimicrobium sp. ORNL1]